MIIWSGWGILVVPITIVVGGAITALVGALLGAAGLERGATLGVGAGLLAAAAVNWWAGQRLNRQQGRVLLDPATGQQVVLRRRHSLFFIPMQWWAVPMAVLGALMLVDSLFSLGSPGAGTRPEPAAGQARPPQPS